MISPGRRLFKTSEVRFSTLALHQHEIRERVYLQAEESHVRIDISDRHWIVCDDPFIVAVWMNPTLNARQRLLVIANETVVGYLELDLIDRKKIPEGELGLFKSVKAISRHSTPLRRRLMLGYLRFKQKENASKNLINYCVAYSYPRNVVLVSCSTDDYFNIFPMDFQGRVPETNQYLFGLRRTNKALEKIIKQRQVVVCEVPATKKNIIYQLGKHHGTAPPSIEALPFSCHFSERLVFPVPDFTTAYSEVELERFDALGSHMLMVGHVINRVVREPGDRQLYHIHSIHNAHRNMNTSRTT